MKEKGLGVVMESSSDESYWCFALPDQLENQMDNYELDLIKGANIDTKKDMEALNVVKILVVSDVDQMVQRNEMRRKSSERGSLGKFEDYSRELFERWSSIVALKVEKEYSSGKNVFIISNIGTLPELKEKVLGVLKHISDHRRTPL